jgi:hypothetical protein
MKHPRRFRGLLPSFAVQPQLTTFFKSVFLGPLICAFFVAICFSMDSCSAHKGATAGPDQGNSQAQENAAPLGPEAKIHISYSRPGDFLTSIVVTEYASAETVVSSEARDASASIVRFDGGVVVWQIAAEESVLNDLPMIGTKKPQPVTEVKYGQMPPNFIETTPENGQPEPLQPGHYYVFTVTRASGAASYEAVKVNGDGSLEAYQADPRAGTSFRLCCNLAPDFVLNADAQTP